MPDEFHPDQCGAIWSEATAAGYTAANLSPMLCRFDREEFAQFLNTFGWFGPPGERPAWHVGPTLPVDDRQAEPLYGHIRMNKDSDSGRVSGNDVAS